MVISFDHVQLREVRRLDEMLPTGALLMGLPAALAQFGEDAAVQSINLQRDFISRELIDDAHRRGIVVQAWTVDDLAQLERLAFLGVDGIVTNYPDRALEWLRANGRHRSC
jgi:glycerophosphoryl diester phosphodiesterase